jgi:hypothetical protein
MSKEFMNITNQFKIFKDNIEHGYYLMITRNNKSHNVSLFNVLCKMDLQNKSPYQRTITIFKWKNTAKVKKY